MVWLWVAGTAWAGFVVGAEPAPVQVDSYKLPKPEAEWIDPEAPEERRCVVDVSLGEDGMVVDPTDCPEVMAPACVAATSEWAVDATEGAFSIVYVMKYSGVVGALTIHAQVDPGLEVAESGVRGPPGVKLVHPAQAVKTAIPKLPRSASKAGIDSATCKLHLLLDDRGRPAQVQVAECPEPLVKAVAKAGKKWRYTPRYVDGYPVPVEVLEHVVVR